MKIGKEIIRDFPNSKIASEILPKLPSLKERIENKKITETTVKKDNFETVLNDVVDSHEKTNAFISPFPSI